MNSTYTIEEKKTTSYNVKLIEKSQGSFVVIDLLHKKSYNVFNLRVFSEWTLMDKKKSSIVIYKVGAMYTRWGRELDNWFLHFE